MKNILAAIFICLSFTAQAQQGKPQLLKEPADWAFERFALPPQFAPNFPYKGAEELRFSPGMFKKDSEDYFTYAFVAQLDNAGNIVRNNVKDYLLAYFKGLCSSTAIERKLVIDTSTITIVMATNKSRMAKGIVYNALLNIFGVFTDGAPVQLKAEIKIFNDAVNKRSYLLFIGSPKPKKDKVWKKLYQLRDDFVMPG